MIRLAATDKPWVLVPGEQLGLVPLPVRMLAALVALGLQTRFPDYTKLILQGTLRPGSLYSMLN
jgi:hypothetical protein